MRGVHSACKSTRSYRHPSLVVHRERRTVRGERADWLSAKGGKRGNSCDRRQSITRHFALRLERRRNVRDYEGWSIRKAKTIECYSARRLISTGGLLTVSPLA